MAYRLLLLWFGVQSSKIGFASVWCVAILLGVAGMLMIDSIGVLQLFQSHLRWLMHAISEW